MASGLTSAQEALAASAAFGSESSATFDFTWFFVVLSPTHFFLDSAAFDQFAESADRFLDALAIPYNQLNHDESPFSNIPPQ